MSRRSQKDIIQWVIDRMLERHPGISAETAKQVEREARAEWGTTEVYIARGRADEETVRSEYAQNRPASEIAQRHGISRRTLYRMLKK